MDDYSSQTNLCPRSESFRDQNTWYWDVKLQTSHQISAKSVNICKSYIKFSKVTKKHISVHYRHRRDWLSSVRPCEWQDVSSPTVCVQNVHRVLEVERTLEDGDATAWRLHRWPPGGGNVPTLRSGATSAGRRHESGCGTHAPAASPNLVVDWVKLPTRLPTCSYLQFPVGN